MTKMKALIEFWTIQKTSDYSSRQSRRINAWICALWVLLMALLVNQIFITLENIQKWKHVCLFVNHWADLDWCRPTSPKKVAAIQGVLWPHGRHPGPFVAVMFQFALGGEMAWSSSFLIYLLLRVAVSPLAGMKHWDRGNMTEMDAYQKCPRVYTRYRTCQWITFKHRFAWEADFNSLKDGKH